MEQLALVERVVILSVLLGSVAMLLAFVTGWYLGRRRTIDKIARSLHHMSYLQDLKSYVKEGAPRKKPKVYYVNGEEEMQAVLKELGVEDDPEVEAALATPKKREDLQ